MPKQKLGHASLNLRSDLQHRHLIDEMDASATTLNVFLRPIFSVILV